MSDGTGLTRRSLLGSLGASTVLVGTATDAHAIYNQFRSMNFRPGSLERTVILSETFSLSPTRASILEAANTFRASVGQLGPVMEELVLASGNPAQPEHRNVSSQARPERLARNAFNRQYFNTFVGSNYRYTPYNPVPNDAFMNSLRRELRTSSPEYRLIANFINQHNIQYFGELEGYSQTWGHVFPGWTSDWRRFASATEIRAPIRRISFGGVHQVSFWDVVGDLMWTGLSYFIPWVNTSTHFRSIFNGVWSVIVDEFLVNLWSGELRDESHGDSVQQNVVSRDGLRFAKFSTPNGRDVLYSQETVHIAGGHAELRPEGGPPGDYNMLAVQDGPDLRAKFVTEFAS